MALEGPWDPVKTGTGMAAWLPELLDQCPAWVRERRRVWDDGDRRSWSGMACCVPIERTRRHGIAGMQVGPASMCASIAS
jgi:hypothetical protein